jgi:hypothetical protein
MTREETELMDRLSKQLVEEKDPTRFTSLVRELEDLLRKDQNSREHGTDKARFSVLHSISRLISL